MWFAAALFLHYMAYSLTEMCSNVASSKSPHGSWYILLPKFVIYRLSCFGLFLPRETSAFQSSFRIRPTLLWIAVNLLSSINVLCSYMHFRQATRTMCFIIKSIGACFAFLG